MKLLVRMHNKDEIQTKAFASEKQVSVGTRFSDFKVSGDRFKLFVHKKGRWYFRFTVRTSGLVIVNNRLYQIPSPYLHEVTNECSGSRPFTWEIPMSPGDSGDVNFRYRLFQFAIEQD